MKHILYTVFFLLPFSIAYAWTPGHMSGGWKLESDIEGVKVYSRTVDGSKFRQIKATASVEAPFEMVLGMLTDYDNYKLWMSNVTDSQVMEKVSDTVHYVYAYEDSPWPVQNRYCVSRMTLLSETDAATLLFESVPNYMKSPRDAIEHTVHKGYWKLNRSKAGCDIEYFIECNPGGHVPTWLVNQRAHEAPSKTLQNLRTQASRKHRP